MSELPRFGQRASSPRQEQCPKHPGRQAVAYCKRCNRPACTDCAIQTEVGSICIDCANPSTKRRFLSGGATNFITRGGVPVTMVLIVLNVAVYLVGKIWPPIFQYLAMNPSIASVEPYRLITTTFVHLGFFHVLFNMMMLYLLGSSVEKVFGWWRYLSIYLLSALGGSMAVIAWVMVQPYTIGVVTIGASGAVYGMFGAIFMVQRRSGMSTRSILILLGINLAYGFLNPTISWQAHIGGFIAGLAVTALYIFVAERTRAGGREAQMRWSLIATAGLAAVFALSTWGLFHLMFAAIA